MEKRNLLQSLILDMCLHLHFSIYEKYNVCLVQKLFLRCSLVTSTSFSSKQNIAVDRINQNFLLVCFVCFSENKKQWNYLLIIDNFFFYFFFCFSKYSGKQKLFI